VFLSSFSTAANFQTNARIILYTLPNILLTVASVTNPNSNLKTDNYQLKTKKESPKSIPDLSEEDLG
jgi:hypothetical protein